MVGVPNEGGVFSTRMWNSKGFLTEGFTPQFSKTLGKAGFKKRTVTTMLTRRFRRVAEIAGSQR